MKNYEIWYIFNNWSSYSTLIYLWRNCSEKLMLTLNFLRKNFIDRCIEYNISHSMDLVFLNAEHIIEVHETNNFGFWLEVWIGSKRYESNYAHSYHTLIHSARLLSKLYTESCLQFPKELLKWEDWQKRNSGKSPPHRLASQYY